MSEIIRASESLDKKVLVVSTAASPEDVKATEDGYQSLVKSVELKVEHVADSTEEANEWIEGDNERLYQTVGVYDV